MEEESTTISIVVPVTMAERMRQAAKPDERSASYIARKALQHYFDYLDSLGKREQPADDKPTKKAKA